MRGRTISIAGSLAQRPGHGGHAWVFLQYLLGFRRLGWDVLFLDELQPSMCVDEAGAPCAFEASWNARYLVDLMTRFGLADRFSLRCGDRSLGVQREDVLQRARVSALLLNVMGFLSDERVLALSRRRVFLDIDPGFGQMWKALGLADIFAGHTDFVTIGQNIGQPDCEVPTCGLKWVTTPQPVVLEQWPAGDADEVRADGAFTSIMSWRGPFGPIEYGGKTYGLRAHEFRKFATLPREVRQTFEVAMDIHPNEARDLDLLNTNGWLLVAPRSVAADPAAYQQYIRHSKAELMVAKNLYVDTRGGWFSDRSICYLASGRPVLAQDTGLTQHYPTGEGLILFNTLDEAAAGVDEINRDYSRHSRAARQLAAEFFDSDKVLARLLTNLGLDA